MTEIIESKQFSLPANTVVEKIANDHYAIIILRKSRIIMSDGLKIVEKVDKIKKILPQAKVSLKTTTAVCSKTKVFLKNHNIDIIE